MPGIVSLVSAISADVIAGLAAAGYPPLTPNPDASPGGILLGRQHQFEQWAPPRIIFTPMRSVFGPRDTGRGVTKVSANQAYDAESHKELQNRAIASEMVTFEVRCWGITPTTGAPDSDFDYTQALYQQVIISTHMLTVGNYKLEPGVWTDSKLGESQLFRAGREFVFGITLGTPVLSSLIPTLLPFAPSDVKPVNTGTLALASGGTGVGCTGN